MSTLPTSNALTNSNESNQAFAQQGSLDWVALGRTQYSVSIAILGRLAKAGIDTLTVAFGQAMCLRIPIGPHGEKILAESMSGLTAKSCAADLIWFGVGVRHILRDLVQTSQGCALVALCAALTEAHSISVSALVLYEIAKECGGPQELAPSLEQWEALIRVAASVFNATTFGLRIHQIAKFGMLHQGHHTTSSPSPHPSDLAKLLLSVGQIVHGSLQSVSVQGGCSCSWIAAWADFVLGLRVLVRDADDNVVYANYNAEETFPQIEINFLAHEIQGRILCVQSSHLIRSGTEFIQKCFSKQRLARSVGSDVFFCPGRLSWETMFSDTFGDHFMILMKRKDGKLSPLLPFTQLEATDGRLLTEDQIFSRLMAIATIVTVVKSVPDISSGCASRYFLRASKSFPELRQCNDQVLFAITNFLALYGPEDSLLNCSNQSDIPVVQTLIYKYEEYFLRLSKLCSCQRCQPSRAKFNPLPIAQFCLLQLVETVLYMTSLFNRVILDTTLRPTIYGLYYLYDTSVQRPVADDSSSIPFIPFSLPQHPDAFYKYLTRSIDESCNGAFSALATIFSVEDWNVDLYGGIARSDGKLYCYTKLLEKLTDTMEEACKIHVGSGHIEYRTRLYPALYDTNGRSGSQVGYPAQRTEVVDTINSLKFDSTSNPIETHLVVEEEPTHLYLRHRISTNSGYMLIAPTVFFERLQKAIRYRFSDRLPTAARERWNSVLSGFQYILVHGEGLVNNSDRCHILRPLTGNVLGRCAAISRTESPMALVKTDDELELFARFWARRHGNITDFSKLVDYYVLIS
jgi:hypothetical protein